MEACRSPPGFQAKLVALKTLAGFDLSIPRMALGPFKDPFATFESVRAYQFFFLLPSVRAATDSSGLDSPSSSRYEDRRSSTVAIHKPAACRNPHAPAPTCSDDGAAPPSPLPLFLPLGLHLLAIIVIIAATPEFFAL